MGTKPISIKPANECEVLTLFPMVLICNNTNPSTLESCDGSISLMVSGGTPPYDINWEQGGYGQTIDNLTYGDFTATTICSLIPATTTTSTTSTTTTTLPAYSGLCMNIIDTIGANSEIHQFLFKVTHLLTVLYYLKSKKKDEFFKLI